MYYNDNHLGLELRYVFEFDTHLGLQLHFEFRAHLGLRWTSQLIYVYT